MNVICQPPTSSWRLPDNANGLKFGNRLYIIKELTRTSPKRTRVPIDTRSKSRKSTHQHLSWFSPLTPKSMFATRSVSPHIRTAIVISAVGPSTTVLAHRNVSICVRPTDRQSWRSDTNLIVSLCTHTHIDKYIKQNTSCKKTVHQNSFIRT